MRVSCFLSCGLERNSNKVLLLRLRKAYWIERTQGGGVKEHHVGRRRRVGVTGEARVHELKCLQAV